MHKYDIVFAGSGLSALLTLTEMLQHSTFQDKKILVLDRSDKRANDRTWCFWASDAEVIPPVLYRTWDYCHFYGPGFNDKMDISPFRYRMVRGVDFYEWAKKQIAAAPNVERVQCHIHEIDSENGIVFTDAGAFQGEWVLNSALTERAALPSSMPYEWVSPFTSKTAGIPKPYIHLLQHFRGWVIRSPEAQFDTNAVTMMDFRIEQQGETRFMYVLPLNAQEALVEFTVFSPALLPEEVYEAELRAYIHNYLNISNFEVVETEFGVIPMSNYPFQPKLQGRVLHIGTAGGFVKASSGYAFKRSVNKTRRLVAHWVAKGSPAGFDARAPLSYRVFDAIFLKVLHDRNELGAQIFTSLFRKLPPALVLRFLDEAATAFEMLRIMRAAPRMPFLKAAFLTMNYKR